MLASSSSSSSAAVQELQSAIKRKKKAEDYKFNVEIVRMASQIYRNHLSYENFDESKNYSSDFKMIVYDILEAMPDGLVCDLECHDIERALWELLGDLEQVSKCYSATELRMAMMLYISGKSETRADAVERFKIELWNFDRRLKELFDHLRRTTISEVRSLYRSDQSAIIRAVQEVFPERIKTGPEKFLRTDPINILAIKFDERDKAAQGFGHIELGSILKMLVQEEGQWEVPRAQERVNKATESLHVANMELQEFLDLGPSREKREKVRVQKSCQRILRKATRDLVHATRKVSVKCDRIFAKRTLARQTIADKIAWRKNSPLSRARITGSDPVIFDNFITEVKDYLFEKIDDGTIPKSPTASQFHNFDEVAVGTAKSRKKFRLVYNKGAKKNNVRSARRYNFTDSEHNSFWTSVGLCMCANGTESVKPIVIHQAGGDKISANLVVGLSEGMTVSSSPSGYMTRKACMMWAEAFVKATGACKENPQFLFIDAHDSHFSGELQI
jgi:hypothetical protein